jgi:diadenosine tetraphosphate (Ap4A) HIT family hydrolase
MMSVSGISFNNFSAGSDQAIQKQKNQIQQEFLQLGKDITSGNTAAAQSDYATLEQIVPNQNSSTTSQISDPVIQDLQQLGQDLQSGNTSAAHSAYSNIQNNVQSGAQHAHFHHHYRVGSGDSGSGSIEQLFPQLQSVQSGNTTTAQQTFATLQQELEQASLVSSLSVSA